MVLAHVPGLAVVVRYEDRGHIGFVYVYEDVDALTLILFPDLLIGSERHVRELLTGRDHHCGEWLGRWGHVFGDVLTGLHVSVLQIRRSRLV